MQKTGDLTSHSPCSICGAPSSSMERGTPLCSRHLADHNPQPQLDRTREKITELMSQPIADPAEE